MPDWDTCQNAQYCKRYRSYYSDSHWSNAAENTMSHHTWERHHRLEFAMGHLTWIGSYFAPLGEGKLLNLHWDPIVLLVVRPAETHYPWKGKCTTERGKKVGSLSGLCRLQYTS